MQKIAPEERWRRDVEERLLAFKQSRDLMRLRSKGLKIFGRTRMLNSEEWWEAARGQGPMNSDKYREFQQECQQVAARFGLAQWTVEMACLLRSYSTRWQPYVVEARWPRFQLVTESNDHFFFQWLSYLAHELFFEWLGKRKEIPKPEIVHEAGSSRTLIVWVPFVVQPERELRGSSLPPRASAFRVVIDAPPGYPPEALAELGRHASQFERELARKLGYKVPQRMRHSSLTSKASKLRTEQDPLPSGGIYDIMDELHGERDPSQEQKLRSRITSQRHRVRKRKATRYGPS